VQSEQLKVLEQTLTLRMILNLYLEVHIYPITDRAFSIARI